MIKNERQYAITKARRSEFSAAVDALEMKDNNDLVNKITIDALQSQMDTFDREISEYEKLRNGKPGILASPIDKLPELLIKARIIMGMSQGELAKMLGIKEQQVQRYEATNYGTASFERIMSIAKSLNLRFEDTKAFIS